jgi:hypothetical protein
MRFGLTPKNEGVAIDRRVIARIYGGTDAATQPCQVLPRRARLRRCCPYTRNTRPDGAWTAPDLARAHQLIAASGARGASVTVWGWTDDPTISPRVVRYMADVLRRPGLSKSRAPSHAHFLRPLRFHPAHPSWVAGHRGIQLLRALVLLRR